MCAPRRDLFVIASEAKQSSGLAHVLLLNWIASSLCSSQ